MILRHFPTKHKSKIKNLTTGWRCVLHVRNDSQTSNRHILLRCYLEHGIIQYTALHIHRSGFDLFTKKTLGFFMFW